MGMYLVKVLHLKCCIGMAALTLFSGNIECDMTFCRVLLFSGNPESCKIFCFPLLLCTVLSCKFIWILNLMHCNPLIVLFRVLACSYNSSPLFQQAKIWLYVHGCFFLFSIVFSYPNNILLLLSFPFVIRKLRSLKVCWKRKFWRLRYILPVIHFKTQSSRFSGNILIFLPWLWILIQWLLLKIKKGKWDFFSLTCKKELN